jgi:hypothetical protein
MYAEKWGWTPDQVDALRLDVEPWLFPVADAFQREWKRRNPKPKDADK